MDKQELRATHRNLMNWLTKYKEQTVPLDDKVELLIFSIASLCIALAGHGKEDA